MQRDVDRLVRAAQNLTGVWPTQAPPAIPGRPARQIGGASYAAHLLGNLKDPRGVEVLVPLLNDEEVADIVPWSLGEIGDRRSIGPLRERMERDDPSVRVLTILALETLNAREALPKLQALLQDTRPSNFGNRTTVAEAARRAIAVLSRLR